MGILFVTWLVFQVSLGRDAAPPVLDLLLGSIGGLWFGMLVRDQARKAEVHKDDAPSPPGGGSSDR